MIVEKIFYSIVYLINKTYVNKYRGGKGYSFQDATYAANLAMGLTFSAVLFFSLKISGINNYSTDALLLITFGVTLIFLLYLSLINTKKKMMRYRNIYPKSKNYVFIYMFILVAMLVMGYLCGRIKNNF